MNTFKRKALLGAVLGALSTAALNAKAGLATAAWIALGPLNKHYEKNWCLYDAPSEEMVALEKTIKEKFNELKSGIEQNQETMKNALDKEVQKFGAIESKTADQLKTIGEANAKLQTELKAEVDKLVKRTLEVEQKVSTRVDNAPPKTPKSVGQQFVESAEYKEMLSSKATKSRPVTMERKTIYNSTTLDGNQPLVAPQRQPGIITPLTQRLYLRDLIPNLTTSSDLVQYAKELVFTNNAGPQGGLTSPTVSGGEGEIKAESNLTFQLASAAVITLAHFMGASRQVLQDAAQLQGYIDMRLRYGLKLEEDREMLTGDGTAGRLNGINNQAAAFSYGASGAQQLDVLLLAFLQVSLANMEASGVILHPVDWYGIMKLKDTTGRYLFSNPHDAEMPRVWGKTVIPSQSQASGKFTAGAFDMGAAIFDREEINVRVSDEHADFFTRNLVAILCEERMAFAMLRPEAFVYGTIGSGAGF